MDDVCKLGHVTWLGQKIQNQKRQQFYFNATGLVKMVSGNQLCLVFVKYIFSFKNKRHYVLVPSPPMKVISFFRLLF